VDFWDATKVLVRRWYVTLPLLLLTIGATGYTAVAVKPDWVLTSYVQLIPPQTTAVQLEQNKTNLSNPWNQLGLSALSQAANYATVDQTFLDALDQAGYSTNFTINVGEPIAGATIEVIGKTRTQAIETTDKVIARYKESVQRLQSQYGVRQQDMITMQRLDQGENLKRPGGKVKRAILAVFGAGFLLTAGSAIAYDAFMRRRRRPSGKSSDAENVTIAVNGSREWLDRDGALDGVRSNGTTFRGGVKGRRMVEQSSPADAMDSSDAAEAVDSTEGTVRIEDIPMDATIMLPMPAEWAPGTKSKRKR
jgi:hypothetical protein